MVLEATMICLDYSEWMRNGDYTPTRLEAQRDAVISLCLAKTDSSPENNVGILRSSSRGVEVLVTLTSDSGKLLSSMHDHAVSGSFDFLSAVQVAQLGLKHRQNKSLQQRIIIFVGSPVAADTTTLVNLAKILKKNSVAVDIINFGEETSNIDKLEAFISAVNNNENSHLLTIPPGPHNLSDALYGSPILGETIAFDTGAASGAGPSAAPAGAAGGGFEFGVDPNLDPELALALRLSYEEERARQEQLNKQNQDQAQTTPASTPASEPSAPTKPKADVMITDADEEFEDDDQLAQALALSVQTHQQDLASKSTTSNTQTTSTTQEDVEMDDDIAQAMALSLQARQQAAGQTGLHQDPSFLSSVLSTLPGVDPNDPNIQQVLAALGKPNSDEKKDDKDSEKK